VLVGHHSRSVLQGVDSSRDVRLKRLSSGEQERYVLVCTDCQLNEDEGWSRLIRG
jgi:hypothetical protein